MSISLEDQTEAKMVSIGEFTKVVAAANCAATELDGEIVILDLTAGVYFGLNPVGATVWNAIQTPVTMGQVYDAVLAEYAADRERICRDVNALVEKMSKNGLVKLGDESVA